MAKNISFLGLVGIFLCPCLIFISLGGVDSGAQPPFSLFLIAFIFIVVTATYSAGIYMLRSQGYTPKRGYTFLAVLIFALLIWILNYASGITEPGSLTQNAWYALPLTLGCLISIPIIPLWALIESYRIYKTHR